jgi:hypothetical protein
VGGHALPVHDVVLLLQRLLRIRCAIRAADNPEGGARGRANLRMEKVHVLPSYGKLSLRRLFLCRQVLKDLNAKAAHAWPIIRARRIVQLLPSSWQPLIRSLTDTINNNHMHGLPED